MNDFPAFPSGHDTDEICPGMSYRQWLAGLAMHALIQRFPQGISGEQSEKLFSKLPEVSFATADLMLLRDQEHESQSPVPGGQT